jgi:integrase
MTITKRSGRYKVEIYDPAMASKKKYVGTFASRSEAKEAGRNAERDVRRRRGKGGTEETVKGWADRWLDLRPRKEKSTNMGYAEQVKPFVDAYGSMRLADVNVELALEWLAGKRWTHGGIRAMFGDAKRTDLVESNPFAGLRLSGSDGRKYIEVLTETQMLELSEVAPEVWDEPVGSMLRALILMAGFVGMRPAELYGLRWSDIDFQNDEIYVQRQYSPKAKELTSPKNDKARLIVLTEHAKTGLQAIPRPLGDELIFRGARGGAITGRVQHYYWHPIRCAFKQPSLELYALRHACAAWLFNDCELPAHMVAQQLGHTDGGALVQQLYGHPNELLARQAIKRAAGANRKQPTAIRETIRRHSA